MQTRQLQVFGASLEELAIRQYRQAGCAARRIGTRNRRRIEIRPDHALARAGLLDLGDHRGCAGAPGARATGAGAIGARGAQRSFETATGRLDGPLLRAADHFMVRYQRPAARYLLALDLDDLLQDCGCCHRYFEKERVAVTN